MIMKRDCSEEEYTQPLLTYLKCSLCSCTHCRNRKSAMAKQAGFLMHTELQ